MVWLLLLPWPLLVLCGLEHIWHIGATLWLIRMGILEGAVGHKPKFPLAQLAAAAMLTVAFRYEGSFLVMVLSGIFASRRKWLHVGIVALAGLFPIVFFGSWSVAQGGTFLPLSIMSKGGLPGDSLAGIAQWLLAAATRLYDYPFMLMSLLIGLAGAMYARAHKQTPTFRLNLLLLATMGLHLLTARVGGYRYEAYLIGLTGIAALQWLPHAWQRLPFTLGIWRWGILALILFPFAMRAGYFVATYPQMVRNIAQQPYLAAQCVQAAFPDWAIGVNDLGAMAYFSERDVTDLVGIGDQAVFHIRKSGAYTPESIAVLCEERDVRLIIGHEIWIQKVLPTHWPIVATWTLPDNLICADGEAYVLGDGCTFCKGSTSTHTAIWEDDA